MQKKKKTSLYSLKPISLSDRTYVELVQQFSDNRDLLDNTVERTCLGKHYQAIAQTCQELAPLVLEDGQTFEWLVQRPAKLFQFLFNKCIGFQKLVRLSRPQNDKWDMVFYCDEITPGNPLKPCNGRKLYCFYISFKQFGKYVTNEHAWLPIACLRHTVLQKLKGGLSQAVRLLLEKSFFGDWNFADGVELGDFYTRATLSNVLADEAALKGIWSCKGSAGVKPCVCCKNVISKNSSVVDYLDASYFVTVEHNVFSDFDLSKDSDVWESVDHLAAQLPLLRNAAFEELQKCIGFAHNPDGLLLDRRLREHVKPISCNTWDFMHTYLQGGVASVEVHLFLSSCKKKIGLSFSHVLLFCQADWRFQNSTILTSLKHVFSEEREACTKESFKGGASELLSALPILAHFADRTCNGRHELQKEVASLIALSPVVSCISRLGLGSTI